jgi:hypothetical protein
MAWQCIEALGGSLVLPSSTLCRHNSTRIVTLIFSDRLESTWRAGKMRLDLRGVYATSLQTWSQSSLKIGRLRQQEPFCNVLHPSKPTSRFYTHVVITTIYTELHETKNYRLHHIGNGTTVPGCFSRFLHRSCDNVLARQVGRAIANCT